MLMLFVNIQNVYYVWKISYWFLKLVNESSLQVLQKALYMQIVYKGKK